MEAVRDDDPPNYVGEISLTKAVSRKYMKERCSSEPNSQLSFKYFVKSF